VSFKNTVLCETLWEKWCIIDLNSDLLQKDYKNQIYLLQLNAGSVILCLNRTEETKKDGFIFLTVAGV
jgi:hypothetical protein